MVAGELQVVEANLDLVTDYDGKLVGTHDYTKRTT